MTHTSQIPLQVTQGYLQIRRGCGFVQYPSYPVPGTRDEAGHYFQKEVSGRLGIYVVSPWLSQTARLLACLVACRFPRGFKTFRRL